MQKKLRIILYGTAACHLCEEAGTLLKKVLRDGVLRAQVNPIDIAESDALMQRYGIRIPVLVNEENGAEMNWPFDEDDLTHFLGKM